MAKAATSGIRRQSPGLRILRLFPAVPHLRVIHPVQQTRPMSKSVRPASLACGPTVLLRHVQPTRSPRDRFSETGATNRMCIAHGGRPRRAWSWRRMMGSSGCATANVRARKRMPPVPRQMPGHWQRVNAARALVREIAGLRHWCRESTRGHRYHGPATSTTRVALAQDGREAPKPTRCPWALPRACYRGA